ncbi:MAG: TIR domain-containing protein [Rhodanobacteraceae bacterium]
MSGSSSGSGFTYRAFISYSHADKAWADWLHKALETYRVPSRLVGTQSAAGVIPRRLNPIFRDREELASAHDLGNKVNAALRQSEALIVICSPHSAQSRWVNEEVLAFKRMGRSERIFCLIVDGEPGISDWPGHEGEECFCLALRHALDSHGQPTCERTEPVAADARPTKDGKTGATLKLIAGLLGVGLDQLKQREQHRQIRRMATVTALALVVMAITSVLAAYALILRHDAVIAQHHAVVAQQAAVRRQKQAEGLVSFMLGDLTTKLRQVDRLDILGSVDDKAMAYFKSLPVKDVSTASLAQRAKALQKIGDVRMNQSRLSDSMDAFRQALRINLRLVELSPDDPARQNAYGENLLWIGFNDWNQGKLDLTESAFKRAAAALERAVRLDPSDNEIQHNLDYVYNNLGHVAEARGELHAALDDYVKDLALGQRMARVHSKDVLWQNALSGAYSNLGDIALAQGQLEDAVEYFRKSQRKMVRVVAGDPHNRQMQDQLLIDDSILGRTLSLVGHAQEGVNQAKAAVGIGDGLITFDPSHTDWQDGRAYHGELLLGQLLLEQGDINDAIKPTNLALATEMELVVKDPGNAEWRSNLAEAQLQSARLSRARKQFEAARRLARQADATIRKLLAGDSPKASAIRIQAKVELLLGQLAADSGDAVSATRYRQQALTRMRPLAAHSVDPRNVSIWVYALLALGNSTQAGPAIGILQKMGYCPAGFVARLRDHGIVYPVGARATLRTGHAMAASATAAKPVESRHQ